MCSLSACSSSVTRCVGVGVGVGGYGGVGVGAHAHAHVLEEKSLLSLPSCIIVLAQSGT